VWTHTDIFLRSTDFHGLVGAYITIIIIILLDRASKPKLSVLNVNAEVGESKSSNIHTTEDYY
jgi:hypothetical protein